MQRERKPVRNHDSTLAERNESTKLMMSGEELLIAMKLF